MKKSVKVAVLDEACKEVLQQLTDRAVRQLARNLTAGVVEELHLRLVRSPLQTGALHSNRPPKK